jgi:hypothetical protein
MGVTLTLFCDFVIDRTIAHGGCTVQGASEANSANEGERHCISASL